MKLAKLSGRNSANGTRRYASVFDVSIYKQFSVPSALPYVIDREQPIVH